MTKPRIYVIDVAAPDGPKNYVTLTPPAAVFSEGLIREAILGVLKPEWAPHEPITPDVFVPNPAFAEVLAEVIALHGPKQPRLRDEARRTGTGYVVLVDQRTPTPEGPVPPEDILGVFRVEDGNIGPYRASPNHRLLTSNGFFQLDDALTEILLQELAARSASRDASRMPE